MTEFYRNLRGRHIEMGGFTIDITDEMDVVFSALSGVFSVRYGAGTLSWGMLVGFIGDNNMKPVENFIKGVVFPTVMRFYDIDAQYLNDIYKAHESLSARNRESGFSENIENMLDGAQENYVPDDSEEEEEEV